MAAAGGKPQGEGRKSIWTIDFESVQERIEARRERIKKRIDAAKRLTRLMKIQKMMGFKVDEEETAYVKDAADTGSLNIHTMNNSGQELVSNVRLAGEFLQVEHRNLRDQKDQTIKDVLDNEERDMEVNFTAITKTWPSQGDKLRGAPTQLFEEILTQKEMCNQMLRSKNNLIEMLEGENRLVDESYKELIEEYHTNISVLSGRMEYHVHSFSQLLKNERKNLALGYNHQKSQQLRKGENAWQALLEGAARGSEEQMKARLDLVEEQEVEMDELIVNDYEMLGDTKQKMEWSIRGMEEQIEMIQAITHLNSERLDYEIHVLNKHEEENAIIKSEQKRKITVLQDTANKLKGKVKDAERGLQKEKLTLVDDIKGIKKQIRDLEEKQKKYGAQSAKTREDMTRMMKDEAMHLLDRIQGNDNLLQRIYLNRPFSETSEASLKKNQMMTRLEGGAAARKEDSLISGLSHKSKTSQKSSKSGSVEMNSEDEQKNLKKMLLTLIEKADFLVEEDLNSLMAILPDKDKLLLKVDSILGALGVKEEKDIEKIFHHLAVNAEDSPGMTEDTTLSLAEKRSRILKVVRGYVEEPEADARSKQKRKALFGTFDVLKSVAGTIKPDKVKGCIINPY